MCRSIKTLFNFDPPASDDEIQAAARQFVRKVSGSSRPSQANQVACELAVAEITQTVRTLLATLVTHAPPRDRTVVVARARARQAQRAG